MISGSSPDGYGGPTLPSSYSLGPGQGTLHFNGLSMRQAYKMVALKALLSSPGAWRMNGASYLAQEVAMIADAMLAEDAAFAERNKS
jgi:hypothetical protein